jgi:group I intron endonuclease
VNLSSGVYKILCAQTGRCYVGSAVDVMGRWYRHVSSLKKGAHHSPKLQSAWNKYGAESFSLVVLETVADRRALVEREQFWIDALASQTKGYNCRLVASSQLGLKMSATSREKISAARKKQKISAKHIEALVKANRERQYKPVSEETRAKLSAKLKGRKLSNKTRAAMSAARRGVPKSEEHKYRMSLAMTASWQNGPKRASAEGKMSPLI